MIRLAVNGWGVNTGKQEYLVADVERLFDLLMDWLTSPSPHSFCMALGFDDLLRSPPPGCDEESDSGLFDCVMLAIRRDVCQDPLASSSPSDKSRT